MSLFAELDGNKRVIRVIVADSLAWCQQRLGGTWVAASETTAQVQGAGPNLYDAQTIAPARFIRQWVQPQGAHDAIALGEWRWHNGKAWRSLQAANVFQPGVASWREMLTEWPAYVQPTGAQDAYQIGEKITEASKRYVCKVNATVWPPSVVPASWALQP